MRGLFTGSGDQDVDSGLGDMGSSCKLATPPKAAQSPSSGQHQLGSKWHPSPARSLRSLKSHHRSHQLQVRMRLRRGKRLGGKGTAWPLDVAEGRGSETARQRPPWSGWGVGAGVEGALSPARLGQTLAQDCKGPAHHETQGAVTPRPCHRRTSRGAPWRSPWMPGFLPSASPLPPAEPPRRGSSGVPRASRK